MLHFIDKSRYSERMLVEDVNNGVSRFAEAMANLDITGDWFARGFFDRSGWFFLLVLFIILLIILIVYIVLRDRELHHDHQKYLKGHRYRKKEKEERKEKQSQANNNGSNTIRWEKVAELFYSQNESDWRMGIIEADAMLEDLFMRLGYPGNTLGERMRAANTQNFPMLNYAWQAHKVRNQIAHQGMHFQLSPEHAWRTFKAYETVFRDARYID